MGLEIERRFIVAGEGWRAGVVGTRRIRQGYLAREAGTSVRVRLADGVALLTIKGPGIISRQEYEYPIAAADAEEMLATICAGRRVTKTRHEVPHDGLVWEVDVFEGHLAGLVLAAAVSAADYDYPFRNPDLPVEERITDLIGERWWLAAEAEEVAGVPRDRPQGDHQEDHPHEANHPSDA